MEQDPRFAEINDRIPIMVGDLDFNHDQVGIDLMNIRTKGGVISHIVVNPVGYNSLRDSTGIAAFDFENGTVTVPKKVWGIPLLIDAISRWRYKIYIANPTPKQGLLNA